MNKRYHTLKYIVFDFLSALIAWHIFYRFRKVYIESPKYGNNADIVYDNAYFLALLVLPSLWVIYYYANGFYRNIYRKSRLQELGKSISTSLSGVVVIFFVLILDDVINSYRDYYSSFFALFLLHVVLGYLPRLFLTTRTIHRLRSRQIGFNTLIVGSNQRALDLFQEFNSLQKSTGNIFVGFVSVCERDNYLLDGCLPHLGKSEDLKELIDDHHIEEVIIALESSESDSIMKLINLLDQKDVVVKAIPSMQDYISGRVNETTLLGSPLIQVSRELLPAWHESVKRIVDVCLSIVALLVLFPVFVLLGIAVRTDSKGSIFYSHQRIGRFGKPFTIFKFRSMVVNAEKDGPALSSENDVRITNIGRFMRKTRLDEIPQFVNVLLGDMSLVGPRPERKFYIDRIVEVAPRYVHLHRVRPGITSWGQVKYGYASSVDEMVERLKYDLVYIENMSLYFDFKILIYTVLTVLKGSGK